jgi:hypothetical protein
LIEFAPPRQLNRSASSVDSIMAIFKVPDDFERLDYALLQNGPISLYYRSEVLAADLDWLTAHEYRIDSFDCSVWRGEKDMHAGLAEKLNFPKYPFPNLDGLNDFLSDLDISETGGRVLVFHRFDMFVAKDPSIAWTLLDIVASNSRYFLLLGKHLMSLVQSDDPKIQFNPVGACPVTWNRKEWLNKSRGL